MSEARAGIGWILGLALSLTVPADVRAQEVSLADLRARAEAGDAEAQNDLGGRLAEAADGRQGSDPQLVEVREWFRRSSAGGSAEGMNSYASMLLLGIGGPPDEAEGRRLRERAAELGSVGARITLSDRYLEGAEGYPRDPARALELMRAAAESSSRTANFAQWRTGMMYLNGMGTTADPQEAFRWVARASNNGEINAMISRAVMLATGQGVAENDVEARSWYERAATSGRIGFAHGLRGLGYMLLTGEGGSADLPRGIAYLRIAAAANEQNARQLLTQWNDRITPEINDRAREISNRWVEEHLRGDD
jgi:uncharacterized protein